MLNLFDPPATQKVFVDAAVRLERGQCGLAVIVRDMRGAVVQTWSAVAPTRTNNEAKYAAAILALQHLARARRRAPLIVFSDSQILVQQMRGEAVTRAPGLRQKQAVLRALVLRFPSVQFKHIPREQNRLADALANEVVDGETPAGGTSLA